MKCMSCQAESEIHLKSIGIRLCKTCLRKIDERINEINRQTTMTLKQQYELLKAVFEEGRTLQVNTGIGWVDWPTSGSSLQWNIPDENYRLKPLPMEFWLNTDTMKLVCCRPEPLMASKIIKLREVL